MAPSSSNLKVMNETSFDQSWAVRGAGAFGQVWKTKHLEWGSNVAIKILGRDNGVSSNEVLEKEAAIMLHVAEGPYIMRIIGIFRGVVPTVGAVMVGLVMEMMERGSLASLQNKLKHLLPWPLVFRLAHQVALGMNYLHCLKPDALIHKDLKPDNLLLDSSLNVKITDFGLTKFVNHATASSLKNFGTKPYMPPDQGGANYAYDVYSYAMVLYSILHTGHSLPVFDNSTERPTLEYVNGMTASGLEELVVLMVKCWNPTPAQRPTFKECIAVTERLYEKHESGIDEAVHKVQQELDGVPVVENPSGTNQDTELKELIDKMVLGLQLQKDQMAEMIVGQQLQKDKMAEMMVELQLQKDKMVLGLQLQKDMMVELQLQKDKMAEMIVALERVNAGLSSIQQYEVDVTLDPDTAHCKLILSEDGKQVSDGDERKNLPDNTERFSKSTCVLGKQGFSSGKFYFEVQVGGKTSWRLGVARESIDRKVLIKQTPNNGYWSVLSIGNEYKATDDPDVVLPVNGRLQKVGVFVNYEEGLVSFYDLEARVHLYSFTGCSFTEKLFPLFNPGRNDGGINSAPLIIHTPSMH